MGDSSKGDDEKLVCAEALTKEIQTVTKSLVDYTKYWEEEDEEEAGERRKETEAKDNIKLFKAVADKLLGADPSDPDVQASCAEMIYMVPKWFR
jgi:hypothetical protein